MLTWEPDPSPATAQVILTISDQDSSAALWEPLFQQKGCTTVRERPEKALQTCKVVAPALLVLDTNLPHSKNLKLCSQLRTITASPILLLVSDYNGSQVIDIYNAGVDECLLKPVSPPFLVVKAISWLLRRRWIEFDPGPPPVYSNM